MAGVNISRNYAVDTMGFGVWDEAEGAVKNTKPLLLGGLVSESARRLLALALIVSIGRRILSARHSRWRTLGRVLLSSQFPWKY